MDPLTLALLAIAVPTVGAILDNWLYNFDVFGEKTAQIEQDDLVKEAFEAQAAQLDLERTATEEAFAEQSDLFEKSSQQFQSSQKQAINMAGVSLTAGSPLIAQQRALEAIEADRFALERTQEVGLSQFDVAEEQALTAYEQFLLDVQKRKRDRRLNPLKTFLGQTASSGVGSAAGTFFANVGGSNTNSTKASTKPRTHVGTFAPAGLAIPKK